MRCRWRGRHPHTGEEVHTSMTGLLVWPQQADAPPHRSQHIAPPAVEGDQEGGGVRGPG